MSTKFYLQLNEVFLSRIFTIYNFLHWIFCLQSFNKQLIVVCWCLFPMTHDPSVITMTHYDSLTQIEIHINISVIRQWYFSHDWSESLQAWNIRQIWYTTWMMATRWRPGVGVFICRYRTFLTFLRPRAFFVLAQTFLVFWRTIFFWNFYKIYHKLYHVTGSCDKSKDHVTNPSLLYRI